jgi:hypothetical protein
MIDPDSRDVLDGCKPSSARTQGAFILGRNPGATEDAAMQRLAAAAPPASHQTTTAGRPGARRIRVDHLEVNARE